MSRLIIAPQFPTPMRYQNWWFTEFQKQFKYYYKDIVILGHEYLKKHVDLMKASSEMFSPIDEAIIFEEQQIYDYLKLDLKDDDILLVNDISFPGLFCNVLFHKRPPKAYAICHATSKNSHDYFAPVRKQKWKTETAHSELFDAVFVGTDYHKKKLGWPNTITTALPKFPDFKYAYNALYESCHVEKQIDITSVSRPTKQKVNKRLEKEIEKHHSPIVRQTFDKWQDYFKHLCRSKCLFISASEETFGYQVLDAVYNDCIPIAPNKYSYPELLPREYLYDDEIEAVEKVGMVLEDKLKVPELLNQEPIDKFYENMYDIMEG